MKAYPKLKRTFCSRRVKKISLVKRLSFFDKILFLINSLLALALLLACLVPFVPANEFPFIAIFSLGVPILVGFNLLFLCYWLLRKKRQAVVSLTVLILGYFVVGSFIGFRFSEDGSRATDLKVMTFNVRKFNRYEAIKRPNVFEETMAFILAEDPDILCVQEVDYRKRDAFKERYPYQHLRYDNYGHKSLMAIFSKYPIVKSNTLDWPNSMNNGCYADILYQRDTIRVYNLHMESLQINPSREYMVRQAKPRLYKNLSRIFKKQSIQAQAFRRHRDSVKHKTIVCGDFNNTQFSNSYRVVKGDMVDTFLKKGTGLGTTYSFLGLPYRIDYILADPAFKTVTHKNYDVHFSDHFPVMASFRLEE